MNATEWRLKFEALKPASDQNQCDGCMRGLPVNERGSHWGTKGFWGGDTQRCTRDLYVKPDSEVQQ